MSALAERGCLARCTVLNSTQTEASVLSQLKIRVGVVDLSKDPVTAGPLARSSTPKLNGDKALK